MGKLIILRGNSGSGKTTVAKELQKKFGYNTMPISQDEIRRNILWVKDGIDTKALPLMIELLKYGYEHSDIVILEGLYVLLEYLKNANAKLAVASSSPRWEVEKHLNDAGIIDCFRQCIIVRSRRSCLRKLQILKSI